MAVKTRPYIITRDGKDRVVEAPNPGAALAHVTADIVTRCDPASGAVVTAFMRAGGVIETLEKPKPADGATEGAPSGTSVLAEKPKDDAAVLSLNDIGQVTGITASNVLSGKASFADTSITDFEEPEEYPVADKPAPFEVEQNEEGLKAPPEDDGCPQF